ncbi:hypothetical protein BC938DRAFT_484062, partial [Jimgerdemannia flammicorona]
CHPPSKPQPGYLQQYDPEIQTLRKTDKESKGTSQALCVYFLRRTPTHRNHLWLGGRRALHALRVAPGPLGAPGRRHSHNPHRRSRYPAHTRPALAPPRWVRVDLLVRPQLLLPELGGGAARPRQQQPFHPRSRRAS